MDDEGRKNFLPTIACHPFGGCGFGEKDDRRYQVSTENWTMTNWSFKRVFVSVLATLLTLRDNAIICFVGSIRLSRYSISVLDIILRQTTPRPDHYCKYSAQIFNRNKITARHVGENYISPEVDLSRARNKS